MQRAQAQQRARQIVWYKARLQIITFASQSGLALEAKLIIV